MDLDDAIFKEVTNLSEAGDEDVDACRYDEAISKYQRALELLPEPTHQWEAATWLLSALGETYYFMGDFKSALSRLLDAMHCPHAVGDPFIHLRLGQVQLELGNEDAAADELTVAFDESGPEIFEDEDPKYFDFLKERMNGHR